MTNGRVGERADVIVVGLGAVGAAALYQLARRGVRAVGLDAHSPPHDLGSSHGETRVTRCGVGEGRAYAPLVARSHEIWRELEDDTGVQLFLACGTLLIANASRGVEIHGKPDFLERTIAVAEEFGVAHEILSHAELRSRFPQFILQGDEKAYFEPGAGSLFPERCIAAQLSQAERMGARILRDERVFGVAQRGSEVVVTTAAGEHHAGAAVLAAGVWSPHLAGGALSVMRLEPQTLHWFDCDRPELYSPVRFPVFMWAYGAGPDDSFYGFPTLPGPFTGGVKAATETRDVVASADDLPRTADPRRAAAVFRQHVEGRLAFVGAQTLKSAACAYTMSPDGDFAIGRLEDRPRVLAASACSGHGFKHSAAVGELLAKVVISGDDDLIDPTFALSRFDSRGASPRAQVAGG
jgi:sarcosine oxidase